jgi:hypothetical protein
VVDPVPSGVTIEIGPFVDAGAMAVIDVSLLMVKLAALTPLNLTSVAPVKWAPVIATDVPVFPFVGVKEVMLAVAATMNGLLVPVPPGVVTLIGPELAPFGTAVLMVVSFTTVKVADVPLNETPVAPVKRTPVIVTAVPGPAVPGDTLVIDGGTPKEPALVPVPAGVVTDTVPVLAAAGTVVVIDWPFGATVNGDAAEPLNDTAVAPWKFAPLIVTLVPGNPLDGLKPVTRGGKAKSVVEQPVSGPGVVAQIGPFTPLFGAVAVICVSLLTVKVAEIPPNVTPVVPVKRVPVIVTLVPDGPLAGVKLTMFGAAGTVTLAVP